MKKFVSTALSTALCLMTVSPAWAQSSSFGEAWANDRPAAVASLNFRVPLGGGPAATERPSYGLTLNYGYQDHFLYEDNAFRPNAQLMDLRFSGREMVRAEVANLTLVDAAAGRTMDDTLNLLAEGGDNTVWIVVGLVAAGVAICLLAECFDDDDDEEEDEEDSDS